jgi:hypothetical protein
MSTLAEIEGAVVSLPPRKWSTLRVCYTNCARRQRRHRLGELSVDRKRVPARMINPRYTVPQNAAFVLGRLDVTKQDGTMGSAPATA